MMRQDEQTLRVESGRFVGVGPLIERKWRNVELVPWRLMLMFCVASVAL
jgi:hypothetical protein